MRNGTEASGVLCGAFFGVAGEWRRGDDDRRVGVVGIGGGSGEAGGERQPGRRLISIFCHWKLFPGNRHGAAPRLARGRQFRLNQARKGGPVLGGSGEAMPGAKPSDGTGAGTGSIAGGAAASTGRSGTIGALASAPHGPCCCTAPASWLPAFSSGRQSPWA